MEAGTQARAPCNDPLSLKALTKARPAPDLHWARPERSHLRPIVPRTEAQDPHSPHGWAPSSGSSQLWETGLAIEPTASSTGNSSRGRPAATTSAPRPAATAASAAGAILCVCRLPPRLLLPPAACPELLPLSSASPSCRGRPRSARGEERNGVPGGGYTAPRLGTNAANNALAA